MNHGTAHLSRSRRVLVKLGEIEIAHRWAQLIGITPAAYQSYLYGRAPFPADLAPALFNAVLTVTADLSLAEWAYSEVCGTREVAREIRPTPQGLDPDPIRVDLLQVSAALGRVSAKLAEMANGDPQNYRDAGDLLADLNEAECQLKQAKTKTEIVASITPQMKIPGAER